MPGYGQVKLKNIWKMLKKCAPGYTKDQGEQKWIIKFKDKEYLDIPLGSHGKKDGQADIERGVVRSMVRHFEIEECASKEIPQLRTKKKS